MSASDTRHLGTSEGLPFSQGQEERTFEARTCLKRAEKGRGGGLCRLLTVPQRTNMAPCLVVYPHLLLLSLVLSLSQDTAPKHSSSQGRVCGRGGDMCAVLHTGKKPSSSSLLLLFLGAPHSEHSVTGNGRTPECRVFQTLLELTALFPCRPIRTGT